MGLSSETRFGFGHISVSGVLFERPGKYLLCRNAAIGRKAERLLDEPEMM